MSFFLGRLSVFNFTSRSCGESLEGRRLLNTGSCSWVGGLMRWNGEFGEFVQLIAAPVHLLIDCRALMVSVVCLPCLPLHLLVHCSKIFQSSKAVAGLIDFAVAILDRSRLMGRLRTKGSLIVSNHDFSNNGWWAILQPSLWTNTF